MKLMTRIGLAACVAAGAIVPASATHSWGGYHWVRTGNTVPLTINWAVNATWKPFFDAAMVDWKKSSVLSLSAPPTKSSADPQKCNPIAGQVLVCNYAYGKRGWLGIASVWLSNGHIAQGTTKLNDSYWGRGSTYGDALRMLVTCQEIGHDFGLAHQNEIFNNRNTGSCMDYTNSASGGVVNGFDYGPSNEHPNQHDYDMLVSIYNHTESAASTNFGVREVGKSATAGRSLPKEGSGDTAAEWGVATHRDGKGRPDQFERRLPDGTIMITHVLWSPDAKGTEAGPVHQDDGHTH
jgi:hypothetical protein